VGGGRLCLHSLFSALVYLKFSVYGYALFTPSPPALSQALRGRGSLRMLVRYCGWGLCRVVRSSWM